MSATTASCRALFLTAALSLSYAVCAAAAAPWARFRGPDGAGHASATDLPVRWTENDYAWRVRLPGSGHSSPVLWGDRIFLTCADEKTALRIVCCLRARDGQLLWRRDYPSQPYRQHRFNHYASASPAGDAERVYATWTTPEEVTALALDHEGREVWRRALGSFEAMHGSGASPIVFEGLVVVPNDQKGDGASLIALDARTGRTRWTHPRNNAKAAYGTPCVYRPSDGPPELILTSTSHGVSSVDPRSGQLNWELRGIFPERCACSPVVASGLIVATCGVGGRGVLGVAVRPGSKARGTEPKLAYRIAKPVPYVPTPIACGDLVFLWGDQGHVACLRAPSGEVVWRERVPGNFFGSPVCAAGRLYCISMKGEVVVLAAADAFQLLARNPLGERSYATPAIAGDTMVLRTYTRLMALRAAPRK